MHFLVQFAVWSMLKMFTTNRHILELTSQVCQIQMSIESNSSHHEGWLIVISLWLLIACVAVAKQNALEEHSITWESFMGKTLPFLWGTTPTDKPLDHPTRDQWKNRYCITNIWSMNGFQAGRITFAAFRSPWVERDWREKRSTPQTFGWLFCGCWSSSKKLLFNHRKICPSARWKVWFWPWNGAGLGLSMTSWIEIVVISATSCAKRRWDVKKMWIRWVLEWLCSLESVWEVKCHFLEIHSSCYLSLSKKTYPTKIHGLNSNSQHLGSHTSDEQLQAWRGTNALLGHPSGWGQSG